MKRWLWVVGGIVAIIAVVWLWPGGKTTPETQLIDYLHEQNATLAKTNEELASRNTALVAEKTKALHARDSLKVVSDSATSRIRRGRTTIPDTIPSQPASAQAAYTNVLLQLDATILELGRKDEIIRSDSVALEKAAAIEINLRQQIANIDAQYKNEQRVSADWKRQFDKLNAERHPKCGRTCNMLLGASAVVVTAIAVRQVQAVIQTRTRGVQ